MVNQKDRLQQRLAERKRSKAMRATSQNVNQTLPLNFSDTSRLQMQGEGENPNDISIATVRVPNIQSSALDTSPLKKS